MAQLGKYSLTSAMTNKNAGTCLWCFGTYAGKEYFIKEFLNPKYPYNDKVATEATIARRKKDCEAFTEEKLKIYDRVNTCSDGNDVRICNFFREKTKFYLSMEKVESLEWEIRDFCALPEYEKRRLCAIIAHAVAGLHNGRLAHADLKHENILYTRTPNGNLTAKIIDFDSAFFEDVYPQQTVSGDQVYFAPEVWAHTGGMDLHLTCKVDLFALGVLFHRYFDEGRDPIFPTDTGCQYAGQAVVMGLPVTVSERIPADIRELLTRMLDPDPEQRPTAEEVFLFFQPEEAKQAIAAAKAETPPVHYCCGCGRPMTTPGEFCEACLNPVVTPNNEPAAQNNGGSYFHRAKDLF